MEPLPCPQIKRSESCPLIRHQSKFNKKLKITWNILFCLIKIIVHKKKVMQLDHQNKCLLAVYFVFNELP